MTTEDANDVTANAYSIELPVVGTICDYVAGNSACGTDDQQRHSCDNA